MAERVEENKAEEPFSSLLPTAKMDLAGLFPFVVESPTAMQWDMRSPLKCDNPGVDNRARTESLDV